MEYASRFFEKPILNSPYEYPSQHWELDLDGQPTQRTLDSRRPAQFITPIPKARRRAGQESQAQLILDEGKGLSSEEQQYDLTAIIGLVRGHVDAWRAIKDPSKWGVSPVTQALLQYWRTSEDREFRPFFAQLEAVETAIWLTEVAPNAGKAAKDLLDHLRRANVDSNKVKAEDLDAEPDLNRLALKLATGAGKTTVIAMLIAWQTVNAVRHPQSPRFTRGFLVITPGITIKDRLRVLQANDPDSYFTKNELVPADMLEDLGKARIVITNYHAFKLRERWEVAKGTKGLLQGRGEPLMTIETEGQMVQRVMPELMAMKRIMVFNDEAHHCYRESASAKERKIEKDEQDDVKKNREAARLWISGLDIVAAKLGISRVFDLSATPFFLRGSGYAEGTLFPWTMSDFSLMDAIECGIVKLPRVPVSENIPTKDMPIFRNLWENIRKNMPKKRRGESELDPLSLPTLLQTALQALFGHYEETFELWQSRGINVPPCFVIVCNNTSTSKLVYDYISGFRRDGGEGPLEQGRLELFRNFDDYGEPLARPRTLLIDSYQLDSGDALDDNFRKVAADEIERFRREIIERTGDARAAEKLTDEELLREVMNTVGKAGRLGESIRCVVSVSMLTEGWDANTVTHILGIRAFGTQLLCEQVIGRALRRQSYVLNEEEDPPKFDAEYADILGIPFDFNAKPVVAPPQPPRETVQVKAMRPERDALEIVFPRVQGYRVELPEERLIAEFNEDSVFELTPAIVGPTQTEVAAIIGKSADLTVEHLGDMRPSTLVFYLTQRLLETKWRDPGGEPKLHLFGQLKRITKQWIDECLVCKGGTQPAQLMYQELADMACERITNAITQTLVGTAAIQVVLDPFNPTGSTRFVNFPTSRTERWQTDPRKCHINWVILDSDWEAEFCRVAEAHPKVFAYAKNHRLDFEVPYLLGAETRRYRPDFIVLVDDGHGPDDLLRLVVEIKGYRGEDAKVKKQTMDTYWVPGVNNNGNYGRWAFAELKEVWAMEVDFEKAVQEEFENMVQTASKEAQPV